MIVKIIDPTPLEVGQLPLCRSNLATMMGALQNIDNVEEKEKLPPPFFLAQSRLICGSSWGTKQDEEAYVCDEKGPKSKGFLQPSMFQTADCNLLVGEQHFSLDCDQHVKIIIK